MLVLATLNMKTSEFTCDAGTTVLRPYYRILK